MLGNSAGITGSVIDHNGEPIVHRSLKVFLAAATVLSSTIMLAGTASASPSTSASLSAAGASTAHSFIRPGAPARLEAPVSPLAVGGWYTMRSDETLITLNYQNWIRWYWIGNCLTGKMEDGGAVCYDFYNPQGQYLYTRSLGGIVFSSICVGLNANNREEVFAKARGKDAVHIWQVSDNTNDWGSWQSLGGLIAENHGVECLDYPPYYDSPDGRLRIRVFGPDGMYHYKSQITPYGDWTSTWS